MNWGVLGCANIARRSVIPAILSVAENRLIAIASRDNDTAKIYADEFNCMPIEGYENLLLRSDIDAVYVPLPTALHLEYVTLALKHKKHVLVEKSAVSSYAEARKIIKAAKKSCSALVENFQFQHHSQHQFVLNLLKNGEIGEVRGFRSSFGFPPFDSSSNIRYNKDLGGGALLDAGAYVLKATTFMFGQGFTVEAAFLQQHDVFNVDWFGGAFLVNREKGIASEVSFGFDNFYQCNYEIWGSTGKITANRAFTAGPGYSPTVLVEKQGSIEEIVLAPDNHFVNMIQHFNMLIKTGNFGDEWNNVLEQSYLVEQVKRKAVIRQQ